MGRTRTVPRRLLIAAFVVLVGLLATVVLTEDGSAGQLTGIVVAVDGDLTDIQSFEVLANGERTRFVPSPTGAFDFPLAHLRDHLRTGEPITVEYQRVNRVLVAFGVSDAR